tara:strand:+ start:280 stop:852 length:573 start_codon:yes stop_codon:yes gene_type:complete
MSFLIKYIEDFNELVLGTKDLEDQLNEFKNCLVSASSNGKKSIIVGNGGSAAIASHFAVDLTKNAKTRCINFNESDLITCFANDYGYENWVKRAIDFYGDEGDVLVAISSSGSSENILNGCREARVKKFSKIITLSGMNFDNPLRELGDINLWANSKGYNLIENIHQFWLLAVVDMIIGKTEYSANPDAL